MNKMENLVKQEKIVFEVSVDLLNEIIAILGKLPAENVFDTILKIKQLQPTTKS